MRQTARRRFVRYTLPLLAWMGLIFYLSGGVGSSSHTKEMTQSILRRLVPSIAARLAPEMVDRIDWNLRKTAHVTEYAILALLAYRAFAGGDPRFRHRNVVGSLALGIGYAASDEWHQSFEPSRWSAASDVFFDTAGVWLGLLLSLWHQSLQLENRYTHL